MAVRIQHRRGTTSEWNSADPVLFEGEIGYNTTLDKFKIGDGSSAWSVLEYVPTSADLSTSLGDYIALTEKGGADGVAELDASLNVLTKTAVVFEGATVDAYETTLIVTDPTGDRTITLPDATGTIALTSDIAELSQDAIDAALTAGTGITKTYNDGANTLTLAVDTTTIQARVADVSDTEIGYLNGVTSAIQTQLNDKLASATASTTYAPLASPTFTGTVTVPTPANATDAVTKAYVDAVTEGLHIHSSVVAATTANVALSTALENGDTLDGITLATNDRILVKNQTTTSENGIYVVQASGQPVRATDFDTAAEVDSGDFVFVSSGTVNGSTGWVQTNKPATIGTDPIAFTQFSGAGTYSAGNGLTLTGTTFTIDTSITQTRVADVSDTEIGYLNGVTSGIQTQLDGKVDESLFDAKGDLLVASADNTPAKLGVGTNGYILTANSGATNGVEWAAAPISLPSQTGNTGKYLTTDGTTASWGTVSSYSAPTIGSTSIASGATVTTIAGLTLTAPNIGEATGTSLTTTGGGVIARAASTQDGVEIRGRSGGTGNWEVILTPTTLTADRTLTLPNETGTILSTAQFSAKGIILVGTGTGTFAAQSVGTNGQVLSANSAQADGVEWVTPAGGAAFSEFLLVGC